MGAFASDDEGSFFLRGGELHGHFHLRHGDGADAHQEQGEHPVFE